MRIGRACLHGWPLAAALLAAGALAPGALRAQDGSPAETEMTYDIPAQPLDDALAAFARQSHVSIAYERRRLAQLRSPPLRGRYTPQAALMRLLAGSGHVAAFVGAHSAVIYPAGGPPPRAARMTILPVMQLDPAEVRAAAAIRIGRIEPRAGIDYARRAQEEIQRILATDPAYRGQLLRLRIAVTADPSGRIAAVAVVRGSGDARRDDRLPAVLTGRRLAEAPPAGIVQPMWFDIFVDRQFLAASDRQEAARR